MKKNMSLCAIRTVLWEKWVEFKYEWFKITCSSLVSPLMYMIALGWGLGSASSVTDRPYIDFLVPGIVAMTTMNTSFNAVGTQLNVQRLFERSFDHVIISPTPMPAYIFGQMLGGALRGMYSGTMILLLSFPFGATMKINATFFLVMLLNGMAFSALGVLASTLAKTHADVGRFSTFLILPMTFLCNTFFPLDKIPPIIKGIIQIMPLTNASGALRAIAYGNQANLVSIIVLAAYSLVFYIAANLVIQKRSVL